MTAIAWHLGADPSVVTPSTQFMRASILAQIGVDGLDVLMENLKASLEDHRYLKEVFVRQLAEIVVRFRLPEPELRKVRLLAANTIVALENPKASKAVTRRNQVIRSLTSTRLKVRAGDI